MSSRSRRSPRKDAGGGWCRRAWCAQAASVAAPERAAAEPYLRTPYGRWLRVQVSRDAPLPLPGGYKLGEKVFYTGASQTWDDGDKLVHGQQGEVMGPATAESVKGKGVDVRFPGNKANISLVLAQVRRLRAASATTPRLCPPHATLFPRPVCVPATAAAAARQPSLHR